MDITSVYDPNSNDTSIQAVFKRVTFVTVLGITTAAAMFINCRFENNTDRKSAIYAFGSKLVFQDSNIFRNNSALAGAGINLIESYLHLQPPCLTTTMLCMWVERYMLIYLINHA